MAGSDFGGYLMGGAGGDIWGTADAFNYLSSGASDTSVISASVTALENTDPFAKAGVMMRASDDASAAHVILDIRPTGDIEFMTRSSSGAETQWITSVHVDALPVFLKLERAGASVTASYSSDGEVWTTVGTVSTDLGSDASMGLVVTSHQRGAIATAQFGNVTLK